MQQFRRRRIVELEAYDSESKESFPILADLDEVYLVTDLGQNKVLFRFRPGNSYATIVNLSMQEAKSLLLGINEIMFAEDDGRTDDGQGSVQSRQDSPAPN